MTDISESDLLAVALRTDLSSFIRRSFATVDPGSTYQHNWHVDAIAHQLARVHRGEITRLIVTLPPRSLKSIAASVAFPAWLLGRDPRLRVLAVSYSEALAEKLALDCRKVLDAPWYGACFPRTRIAPRRAGRSDFETTAGGGRYSTSVGGTLTGRGGDIILIDDPHKPEEAQSELRRRSVLDWYRSTLLSRCNDPLRTPIVLIQQRVHEEDLAGMLLDRGGWTHLNLPAIAEADETHALGRRGTIRRREGDLLHAARLPCALLETRRAELGSYVFAAQYQQRPAPRDGGLVRWDWFRTSAGAPRGGRVVQSWETASTAGEMNDYSVGTTWRVHGPDAWLLDVCRARLEFPELARRIVAEAERWNARTILIEKAGSGLPLLQHLRGRTRRSVIGVVPRTDKATRLMGVTHVIEAGRIVLPEDAPWLADFRSELLRFPNGKHDDQADSLSQFLTWFTQPQATGLVGRQE